MDRAQGPSHRIGLAVARSHGDDHVCLRTWPFSKNPLDAKPRMLILENKNFPKCPATPNRPMSVAKSGGPNDPTSRRSDPRPIARRTRIFKHHQRVGSQG